MRPFALALLVVPVAGLLAPGLTGGPSSPVQLHVDVAEPEPLPAGAQRVLAVDVQRRAEGHPVPGPGEVELVLEASSSLDCGPEQQTVQLDPATGHGDANVTCQPREPGNRSLAVHADADAHRPGSWNTTWSIEPDPLQGELGLGEPEAYRAPVDLALTPAHLDRANVTVQLGADHRDSPLGLQQAPRELVADGASRTWPLVARHGPGEYRVTATADGPAVEPWRGEAEVTVPEPDAAADLALNATVEPGQPRVALTSDGVNDDGKTKRPGDALITRLATEHVDEVNLTVLRAADGDPVELANDTISVDPGGSLEHVFTHEPLPATQLWVQAQAGDSSTARTAQIRDLRAEADLEGPGEVLGDGRAWQGTLTMRDPNFGSTPADPGPVFGLPDVTWTLYRGSTVAEGFTLELGPFAGASEAAAQTGRVPWPQGTEQIAAEAGLAEVPVEVHPPADVEPGSYRLSVYAPDGTRLGGGSLEFTPPPEVELATAAPRPGQPWNASVDVEDAREDTQVTLRVLADGDPVANRTVAPAANASIALPTPLPAGTPVRIEAWADWPGRPDVDQPDAAREATVADLGPRVRVHAVLDGHAAEVPLALHPAGAHEVELVYEARDPNTGPASLAEVHVEGPDGSPGWPVNVTGERVRVQVPAEAPLGRYVVELVAAADGDEGVARVPLEVAPTVRLGLEGPRQLSLRQGETSELSLTVHNRGSRDLQAVQVLADTDLEIALQAGNGTAWVGPETPLGLGLPAGGQATLAVRVTADGAPGEGSIQLTVAGVVP